MSLGIDPLDLVEPARFARNGYPHDVWTKLRAEAPVAYLEPPGHPSFWAVTRHTDIVEVATQPQIFSNAKGITLDLDLSGFDQIVEMIVYLDPPRHGPMRKVAVRKFVKTRGSDQDGRDRAHRDGDRRPRPRPTARSPKATSSTSSPDPSRWR